LLGNSTGGRWSMLDALQYIKARVTYYNWFITLVNKILAHERFIVFLT